MTLLLIVPLLNLFFCGGSQAICLAHSLSLPPASSQMAKAPTAPKPAAKHTVFPQMAFRCNYVLSIQNLWCAERKEPAEHKWHFNIKINSRRATGAECVLFMVRAYSLKTSLSFTA